MSSKRRQKRRGHDGKIAYATKQEALAALRDIRRNHPSWGYMNAYRCPFAKGPTGHWHIGHPPRIRKKRRRKS